MSNLVIMTRRRELINTDPQRRCYNGAHFSSKIVWGGWSELERVSVDKAERRLKFWQELNEYAVSQRGKEAKAEFKLEQSN